MGSLEHESTRLLKEATAEELNGARKLWERHKAFLRGMSSVSGAPQPEWEGLKPVQQAAHLEMFRAAHGLSA
jgi:hypothetical protein